VHYLEEEEDEEKKDNGVTVKWDVMQEDYWDHCVSIVKLAEKIAQEQKEKFGFSYRNGEDLYIAFGFGERPTGGYSIQIAAVKDMGSRIIVEAHLIAPKAGEVVSQSVSYPYMVLKTKDTSAEIQFRLKDAAQN